MKKNIIKGIIALIFVVGAIVSFNVEAKAHAGWWVVHFDYNDSTSCYDGGASCCPQFDCIEYHL